MEGKLQASPSPSVFLMISTDQTSHVGYLRETGSHVGRLREMGSLIIQGTFMVVYIIGKSLLMGSAWE